MATVYLAEDVKHHRKVALKVLRPELAAALGTERFLREITTTAQLTHPHILPLLDSGQASLTADGGRLTAECLYYVMPYVEGESLRDRLNRERQLPLDDALQIAREVADALSYAHSHGVVHRDIKPENILLQSGHAVVADFGIAKAIAAAGSERLTETGIAVGTPQYMSPEQAAGAQALDGRSDLYSLGCVLYEMLAGQPPFSGPTADSVVRQHLAAEPPSITVVRPAVPTPVATALGRSLAKTPADRFATAAQFAKTLESAATGGADDPGEARGGRHRNVVRFGAVAAAAIVVSAVAWVVASRPSGRAGDSVESLTSVAVLPFTVSGDSSREYLGDGFTDAVIDALVRVQGLRVPASSRVFPHRGRTRDVREIGRELGVEQVVTGSIQLIGSRLRVRAQLERVGDGTTVWSLPPFDGDFAAVFAMQDSIAAGVVEALQVRRAGTTGAAVARGVRTRDMEAYRLYLQARRATYELSRPGLLRAITLLEQALARDSTYADAWVALADAYSFYHLFGDLSPAEAAGRWRRAAERGIALDSLNGFAFTLRGFLRSMYDWDWDGSWADLRWGVRLSPASADAVTAYSEFLRTVGEPDSALNQARRAVALDRTSSYVTMNLAYAFAGMGMPDSARVAAEHALALDSTQWAPHHLIALLLARSGRRAEAEREVERMLRSAGEGGAVVLMLAASDFGEAGRPDRAREMLRRLEQLGRRQYVPMSMLVPARLAAGDRARALDALEEAARNHDLGLTGLLAGNLQGLEGEPRYVAVRRAVFGDRPGSRGMPHVPLTSP